jgi:hypothetical protein
MTVIEILVPMTWPEMTCKHIVWQYKYDFVRLCGDDGDFSNVLNNIFSQLIQLLSVDFKKRNEKQSDQIRFILFFFRNLLISKPESHHDVGGINEKFILLLEKYHFLELFLSITSSIKDCHNEEYGMILLEIFHGILIDYMPSDIFGYNFESSNKIKELRLKENCSGRTSSRHPRFKGIYRVKTFDDNISIKKSIHDEIALDELQNKSPKKGKQIKLQVCLNLIARIITFNTREY